VNAVQLSAFGAVDLEGSGELRKNVIEVSGLSTAHRDGVAVHRVATPNDRKAASSNSSNQLGQLLLDQVLSQSGDQGHSAGHALGSQRRSWPSNTETRLGCRSRAPIWVCTHPCPELPGVSETRATVASPSGGRRRGRGSVGAGLPVSAAGVIGALPSSPRGLAGGGGRNQ
jgi:hypothetical protein